MDITYIKRWVHPHQVSALSVTFALGLGLGLGQGLGAGKARGSPLDAQPPREMQLLAQTKALVDHQQTVAREIRRAIEQGSRDPETLHVSFLLRIERQIFKLSASLDETVKAYGEPVYQSNKTRVCSESSNLIATGKAMIRLLEASELVKHSVQDFKESVAELITVKKELNC